MEDRRDAQLRSHAEGTMTRPARTSVGALRIGAALLLVSPLSVGPVLAHENPQEMGAGPAAADKQDQGDAKPAAEGTKPGDAMAGMNMEMDEGPDPSKPFPQRLASWLGRLHPSVVHFPIAMFIGAFFVEMFGLWRRSSSYQHAAYVMLVVGALGAVAAAFLGWFAGGFYLTDRNPVLATHRWLGTLIAIAGLVIVFAASRRRRFPEKSRTILLLALGLITIAVSIQGFLGGTFMHGGMRHLMM